MGGRTGMCKGRAVRFKACGRNMQKGGGSEFGFEPSHTRGLHTGGASVGAADETCGRSAMPSPAAAADAATPEMHHLQSVPACRAQRPTPGGTRQACSGSSNGGGGGQAGVCMVPNPWAARTAPALTRRAKDGDRHTHLWVATQAGACGVGGHRHAAVGVSLRRARMNGIHMMTPPPPPFPPPPPTTHPHRTSVKSQRAASARPSGAATRHLCLHASSQMNPRFSVRMLFPSPPDRATCFGGEGGGGQQRQPCSPGSSRRGSGRRSATAAGLQQHRASPFVRSLGMSV